MKAHEISVIVTCRNEEANIARCLDSVTGFGPLLVVDSFSSDATVAIARDHGAVVYQRPYRSAASQKNWALARIDTNWVLILDADEALTSELRREVEHLHADGVVGYWIRRRSTYLGRGIRGCGWQRDRVLRLFDRRRGRYDDVHVHEEVSLDGVAATLANAMVHHPYRDVEQHLAKINEYSGRGARDFVERGGKYPVAKMLFHPPVRFLRMYLLQWGLRDGWQGAVLCMLASWSVFLKYAKAWELSRRRAP